MATFGESSLRSRLDGAEPSSTAGTSQLLTILQVGRILISKETLDGPVLDSGLLALAPKAACGSPPNVSHSCRDCGRDIVVLLPLCYVRVAVACPSGMTAPPHAAPVPERLLNVRNKLLPASIFTPCAISLDARTDRRMLRPHRDTLNFGNQTSKKI